MSPTGTPHRGWSAARAARTVAAGFGEARVGGVGLGEGPLAVDHQPGVEGAVLPLRDGEVGLGQVARADLAGAQQRAISWAWSRVRSAIGYAPAPAAEDRRHHDEVALRSGALARASSTASEGRTTSSRRMFASSIVWAVGGMCSVSRVARTRVLVEDVVELALEARQLLLGQTEAGEVGDVLDVGTGQVGHAGMIPGHQRAGSDPGPDADGRRLRGHLTTRSSRDAVARSRGPCHTTIRRTLITGFLPYDHPANARRLVNRSQPRDPAIRPGGGRAAGVRHPFRRGRVVSPD